MTYMQENIVNQRKEAGKAWTLTVTPGKWRDNYNANYASGVFKSAWAHSLAELKKINLAGRTIMLVAASPHLDETVEQLKEYRDRLFIICCDVAINCLAAAGIRPDLVIALDTSPVLALHFSKVDTTGIPLACPTTIHPRVIEHWHGSLYFFNQRDEIAHKDRFLKQLTRLTSFPTLLNLDFVGATAYQVARMISDRYILLMGYGFSFLSPRRYCAGVYEARGVPAKPVDALTSKQLLMFIYQFNRLMVKDELVVNCTGGGILQKNNVMTIKEAEEKYGIWN